MVGVGLLGVYRCVTRNSLQCNAVCFDHYTLISAVPPLSEKQDPAVLERAKQKVAETAKVGSGRFRQSWDGNVSMHIYVQMKSCAPLQINDNIE